MLEKPSSSVAIGIEKQSSSFAIAILSLEDDKKVSITIADENVKQFYNSKKDPILISTLLASETLIRPLEVKLKKEKDIDATLLFHAEPLLPYPTDEAIVDKIILSKNPDGSKPSPYSAKKMQIKAHIDSLKECGFESEVVTTIPLALEAFAEKYSLEKEPFFIIHLGSFETTLVLISNHLSLTSQSCQSTVQDITRTFYSLLRVLSENNIQGILFTGENSVDQSLTNRLLEATNQKALFAENAIYAVPIGAALTTLTGFEKPRINFRKNELKIANPWKRYHKLFASYLGLCVSVTLALFLLGKAYINYHESLLKQSFVNLLSDSGKPYPVFENEYRVKRGLSNDLETPLKELSLNEIKDRLLFFESSLNTAPDLFPLHPNIPYVSDLLAWISKHPAAHGSTPGESLKIEHLSYTLIKRPDQTKINEHYKVKVELEFISPTPKQAREFHDALIASSDFIDSKEEVKWSSNRGHYRTSFFLKDKTKYRNK